MNRIILSAIWGILVGTAATAHGQTLQSETTWGGFGAEFTGGVATATDGSAYLTGTTDSFAVDQFGSPDQRIFILKFAPDGSLAWQRIWNGRGVHGKQAVTVASDGSVYVTGLDFSNDDGNAVLLKFSPSGALIWERVWGGSGGEGGHAVATDAADGSVYIGGRTTSFPTTSTGLFVVKFSAAGALLWQKVWDNVSGEAVTVAPDGSVYAAATAPRPGGGLAEFDVHALKITSAGSLVWARAYQAGEVVDARGGMAAAPDSGSIAIAGAVQAPEGGGSVGIAALLLKIDSNGNLVFDREFVGKAGEEASGVSFGQDGSIYMSGTSTSFGVAFQEAFVVRVQANGKAVNAATWGGPAFETGGGVSVTSAGTVVLGANTTVAPPYSLLSAPRKVSNPHGALAAAPGALADATGVVTNPAAGVTATNGSIIYSGNFEAALVRYIF